MSRSSALASKATGYPIAKIATKIAVGYHLKELKNPVTKRTYASFEPALDYIVTKIPRWPFDKFSSANRKLGTQMKATGEVMAIGRTFGESLLKGIRSLDMKDDHLLLPRYEKETDEALIHQWENADDERLFAVAEGFRRGFTVAELHKHTAIDAFYLMHIEGLVHLHLALNDAPWDAELLQTAKENGFSDLTVSQLWDTTEGEIRAFRKQQNMTPVYKMVDTCAAEFASETPYFYSTFEEENESIKTEKPSVLVLGSGRFESGKVLNLIMRPFIACGRFKKLDTKRSSSTITPKPCQPILVCLTNYISNR